MLQGHVVISLHHLTLLFAGYKPGHCTVRVKLVVKALSIIIVIIIKSQRSTTQWRRHAKIPGGTSSFLLTLYVDDSHARVQERRAYLSAVVALGVGGGGTAGVARQ